jgi:hypothetical protein
MNEDPLRTVSKILAKHRIHADKISDIQDDYGIDLTELDIDITNEVFSLIGAPEDTSADLEMDDPDFSCNDWIFESMNDCGSNEEAIYNFLLETAMYFKQQ